MQAFYQTELYPEAGCDEAGRGCLAGPVVAAAVVFPKDYWNDELSVMPCRMALECAIIRRLTI